MNTINSIPQSVLGKLYDSSGTSEGGNRGFFLFYVNQDGIPAIANKTENACVSMALRKTMELFLNDAEPIIPRS